MGTCLQIKLRLNFARQGDRIYQAEHNENFVKCRKAFQSFGVQMEIVCNRQKPPKVMSLIFQGNESQYAANFTLTLKLRQGRFFAQEWQG